MESQDPPVASSTTEPASPGFARRAAQAFKKAVWRSEPDAETASAVATVATLTDRVKKYLPSADVQKIKEAFRFSDEAHLGQFRRSGAPYITHPLAVAEILTEWHLDGAAIQAALLHDVMRLRVEHRTIELLGLRLRNCLRRIERDPCSFRRLKRRRPRTSQMHWRLRANVRVC